MHRIVVTDIFGRTAELEYIAESLSGSVDIFDPYRGQKMQFPCERAAYEYFSQNVGLENYAQSLGALLENEREPVSLLGFSVGSSIIWKNSQAKGIQHVSGALCFYGSQIRNFRDISPRFPVSLVLPMSEEHFSVSELINELTNKPNVRIQQSPYLHGFMNHHSKNFDPIGYGQYSELLNSVSIDACLSGAVITALR